MKRSIYTTLICLILALSFLCSSAALAGCKEAGESDTITDTFYADSDGASHEYSEDGSYATVAVIGSPKVLAECNMQDVSNEDWDYYKNIYGVRTAAEFSEAIFKSAVDSVIQSGANCVIIVGDLTEDCGYDSMKVVASGCEKIKAAGIGVFVTGGIHDVAKKASPKVYGSSSTISAAICQSSDYQTLIGPYSFTSATSMDANSLSYAADIPNTDCSVITLECASTYTGDHNDLTLFGSPKINDGTIEWLEGALQNAEKRGRTPIFVSYFPLNTESIDIYGNASYSICYALDRGSEILDLLLKYNVHTMISSQAKLESYHVHSKDGKSIAELSSSSLAGYPCAIKYCRVYKGGTGYSTRFLQAISEGYLPSYTTAEQKTKIAESFIEFMGDAYYDGFQRLYHGNIFNFYHDIPQTIYTFMRLGIYGEDIEHDKNVLSEDLTQELALWMYHIEYTPLYGEGDTIETDCKNCGITLPASDYISVDNFIFRTSLEATAGILDPEKQALREELLYAIFCSGLYTLCDLHVIEKMHDINEEIIPCDITPVITSAIKTGTIDLTQNDAIISVFSILLPMLKDSPLFSTIKALFVNSTAEELLGKLRLLMPALTLFTPEIVLFTGINNDLETSFMSFSKGEIYLRPFVTDILFDVIYRTSILCMQ